MNPALAWLYRAGTLLAFLANVILLRPKGDLHDPAYVAGIIVGGLLVQTAMVGIAFGIHRLLRRPKKPLLVVAFWTLITFTGLIVLTIIFPPGRTLR